MVSIGREVINDMSRDHKFGPMVMFGLGRIYVNFLKDVVFRIAPLNARDADGIVKDTKSYTLLRGLEASLQQTPRRSRRPSYASANLSQPTPR